MARQYVFEHVWQYESPADRRLRTFKKNFILGLYCAGLGLTAGGFVMALYLCLTW